MDNKILKKYQDRLNDISRRNRAIRLSRIIKKKTFDTASLSKIEKDRPAKLVNSLFLLNKGYKLIDINIKDKDEEKILKDILYLKRDVDFILKEKGYYECYLGYPFIQGNFFEGSFFRAPLFLVPIQINLDRDSAKIVIEPVKDSDILVNKTFFLAFNKYNKDFKNIDLKKLDEIEELPREKLIEWGIELFKKLSMKVDLTDFKENKISPIDDLKSKEHPTNLIGEIKFLPLGIIGQFNQINSSLNNDYEDIIKNKKTNEVTDLIMGNEAERDLEERFDDEKLADSSEEDNFFITTPDISQEQVLIKSRNGKGLVIHGPPGTGKSQVITNLIADNLLRNKRILLVCEKRAALDVVKNRLAAKGINKHCLLVHDSQNDRDRIFKQIELVLNEFDSKDEGYAEDELKRFESKMTEKAQQFDSQLASLKVLIDLMHETNRYGTNLYTLYRDSKKDDDLILTIPDNVLGKVNFKDLQISAEKIAKLSNRFYKFESPDFSLVNRKRFGTSFDDIKFKEELMSLLKILETLEKIFYTKEFKDSLKSIKYKYINFEDLTAVLSEIKDVKNLRTKFSRFFNADWWALKSKYRGIITKDCIEENIKLWELVKRSFEELSKSLKYLESVFNQNFVDKIQSNVINFNSNLDVVQEIINNFKELEDVISFDSSILSLKDFELDLAIQCFKNISPKSNEVEALWQNKIKNGFYLGWIKKLETENPEIREFSFDSYNHITNKLHSLIKEKTELIPKVIYESFLNKYNKIKWEGYDFDGRRKNYNNLKYILHEVEKKRRRMTLRQFFESFHGEGLLDLFPCWMCSPETVSSTFPMRKNIFDIVIFDEASQCKLERAIPSIIRGKKLIVAGDEKQLPPTTFFIASTEEGLEESEEYEYDEKQLLEDESLLERSKTVMPGKRLIYHYRSNHEELINFSNYAFYDRSLRIIPRNSIPKEAPIDYQNVKGVWDSGINVKEAKEVVSLIKKLLKNNKHNLTMGIITFNVKQKDLIEELLDEEARRDKEFAKALDREKERFNNEEYIGLFTKNIENVQGDERDIIIFSISYGFDRQGKFRYMFGPLNGPYGPNRLNVAISRAREKVIIVSSFEPQDLKYAGTSEGPKLLREYLDYARYISKNDKVSADQKLENINQISEVKSEDFDEYDSDFEGEVRDELVKLGFQIKTQVGCKGYKIDLAVVHPKDKKRFIAGIECDGAKYHSSKSAKDRDLYRQGVLEESGWKILRIWSRDWWKNKETEIKRINREIKGLLN